MTNDFYYNKGVQITREEAHALTDKSGLVVADRQVNFKTEAAFKGTKMGLVEDLQAEPNEEDLEVDE